MDYLFGMGYGHGKGDFVEIYPTDYTGDNPFTWFVINDYKNIDGKITIPFNTAIKQLYFENSYAHPEVSHCSRWSSTGESPINCLAHFINNGGFTYDSLLSEPIRNIINSGAKCSISEKTTTTCLDYVLNKISNVIKTSGNVSFLTNIRDGLDTYDFSVNCTDAGSGDTIPCAQKLLSDYDYKQSLISMTARGSPAYRALTDIVRKQYTFINDGIPVKTTGTDYIVDNGSNLLHIFYDTGMFSETNMCKASDGEYISCISKIIMNLSANKYTSLISNDLIQMIDGLPSRFLKPIMTNECSDGRVSIPCISRIIDMSSQNNLDNILLHAFHEYPMSGISCVNTGLYGKNVFTNCLDKIVGMSQTNMAKNLVNSGTLIDTNMCFDWDGNRMNCLDKLFQRHEMWVHYINRKRELEFSNLPPSVRYKETKELENIAKIDNVMEDPGFNYIAGEYDIGAIKVHSPSKAFSNFATIIKNQIAEYQMSGEGTPLSLSEHTKKLRLDYSTKLLKSITSDAPKNEGSMIPKIYNIVDAYGKNHETGFMGMGSLIADSKVPFSYNMFECHDENDQTISCIQRHIDEVHEMVNNDSSERFGGLQSVARMKDLFKEDLCVDGGERMSCILYAFRTIGSKQFTENEYTSLIGRKDFSKVKDYKIPLEDGTSKTLSEIICSHTSIERISRSMDTITQFTNAQMDEVLNSQPSHDGAALKLYSSCICQGITDPMERRMCLDKQCLSEYVRGTNRTMTWAANFLGIDNTAADYNEARRNADPDDEFDYGNKIAKNITMNDVKKAYIPYKYHGSNDYFGLAGVYNVDFNPADYHITNVVKGDIGGAQSSKFDLTTTLEGILLPAAMRTVGITIPMMIPVGGKLVKGDAKIRQVAIEYPPDPDVGEYRFGVVFDHGGNTFTKWFTPMEAFGSRGFFNRSDLHNVVFKYRKEQEAVSQILTRQKAIAGVSASLKLVVSNRPVDYMRASTCQQWRSCLHSDIAGTNPNDRSDGGYSTGFNGNALAFYIGTGGYVAYLAPDEFSPTWLARSFLIPMMNRKEGDSDYDRRNSNNNFRINKVYGLPSYRVLITDALRELVYRNGYNHESMTTGDCEWHVSHWVDLKGNLLNEVMDEAYENCIERQFSKNRPVVELPTGRSITPPTVECSNYLHPDYYKTGYPGDRTAIIKATTAYRDGLISKTLYHRALALDKWGDYDDSAVLCGRISEGKLREGSHNGHTVLLYQKPLTVPSETS
jgi:hypothetical protein